MIWTDELVAAMHKGAVDGLSAGAVGAAIGVSRSAVLGAAHRRGITFRGQSGGARVPKVPRPPRPKRAPPAAPAPPRPIRATRPTCKPVALLELTNETCRWPVTNDGPPFLFCGDPSADAVHSMPYCLFHSRMAYSRHHEAA